MSPLRRDDENSYVGALARGKSSALGVRAQVGVPTAELTASQQLFEANEIFVALDAFVFSNAFVRAQPEDIVQGPRLLEDHRVFDHRLVEDRFGGVSGISLDNPHLVAMVSAGAGQPCVAVKPNDFYN